MTEAIGRLSEGEMRLDVPPVKGEGRLGHIKRERKQERQLLSRLLMGDQVSGEESHSQVPPQKLVNAGDTGIIYRIPID